MNILVNGQPFSFDGQSVADLLTQLDLKAKAVAVEINQEVIPKRLHRDKTLHENDQIEIVTLVGGG